MNSTIQVTSLQLWGAFAFGAVIGWYLYFINRYRKDSVALADLVTVVSAIGGGAVLALFPAGTSLFGAYGVGLAAGFFLYFAVLCVLVWVSPDFDREWFLDGRHKELHAGQIIAGADPTVRPMGGAVHVP